MSVYTMPNAFELELAGTAAECIRRELEPADVGTEAAGAVREIVADLLAAHRQRCTSLVETMLERIAERGISEHALAMYVHGYTPESVRGLVDAYRSQRAQLLEASRFIRDTLSRDPGGRSTFEELEQLRRRVRSALDLARLLRGTMPDLTLDAMIDTLEGR